MKTLPAKLVCGALFANFFLAHAAIVQVSAADGLPGIGLLAMPDASGTTALTEPDYVCNPALFANLDSAALAAVVVPSRFGLSELARSDILLCIPVGLYATGGSIGATGNALYNDLYAAGFFSVTATPDFSAGISAALRRLSVRNATANITLSVNIGVRLALVPELALGIVLRNIARADSGAQAERAAVVSAGTTAGEDVDIATSVVVYPGQLSSWILAARYSVTSSVQLRLGVQTAPRAADGGIAWTLGVFTVSGILHYHSELGFSQTIGCIYRW